MKVTIWAALGLVLIVEGLGPLLFPYLWRKMLFALMQQPDASLRRLGGGVVVAGCVIFYMLGIRQG